MVFSPSFIIFSWWKPLLVVDRGPSKEVALKIKLKYMSLSAISGNIIFFYLVSFSSEAETHTAEASFEFLFLCPQPPKYWDYRASPPCLTNLFKNIFFSGPYMPWNEELCGFKSVADDSIVCTLNQFSSWHILEMSWVMVIIEQRIT